MTDFVLVQIFNARKYLLEKLASIFFLEPLPFDYEVEELPTTSVFHNEKELSISLDNLVELYHVWMAHYLQDLNLPGHSLYVSLVQYFVFLEDLDGDLFPCEGVGAESDLPKGPLAQGLS